MKDCSLTPKYKVGTKVVYTDRHNRLQTGVVRYIEGRWYKHTATIKYCLSHPSYANGQYYCQESGIHGEVGAICKEHVGEEGGMSRWLKPGSIRCWSCREWMSNNELENADGFCPHCDVEIDRRESPYVDEEPTK